MRFGLVGTGHWARITHAPALASIPGASFTAVWGRDPAAAAGTTVVVWGEAGRSIMPADPVDPVAALRTAAVELIAGALANRGASRLGHPCDVRFGRDITRVLADAEAQLMR